MLVFPKNAENASTIEKGLITSAGAKAYIYIIIITLFI